MRFSGLITTTNTISTFLFVLPITTRRSSLLSNFNEFNLNIARACCNDANLCNQWYEQRPSDNCFFYRPPRRAWWFGDPHFQTLDEGNYTFNGWGEYTLLQTMDGFMVQGRTVPVNISDSASATQFSAFALGTQNTNVEVRLNGSSLQVLLNSTDITDTVLNVDDVNDDVDSVIIQRMSNSSILITFENEISITVSSSLGLLNTDFELPDQFMNNVSGLLGNFNGDSSDDLRYPNDTALELPTAARDIHYFGQSWQIDGSSSLFTYPPGTTYLNFSVPDHLPVFLDEVLNTNDSAVVSQCQNNPVCIFDAIQTGNIEIGMNTMQFDTTNVEDRENLENFPPFISGPTLFQVTPNVTSVFTIQVNDTNLMSFTLSNGPIQGGMLNREDSITYRFTWTPSDTVNSSIIFLAVDERNASSMYEPIIEVCPCLNNGTCTTGGVENPSANPLILNCICTPAWAGQICERDFNACTVGFCFEGVNCTDNQAPLEGATCGDCPMGYEGDGIKCEDVNECNGTNVCQQQCTNTAGSFTCSCFAGYQPVNATHCRNIDECLTVGRCHQVCTDTEGSFECSCNPGFQLDSDNFTCTVSPGSMCRVNNCTQLCVRDNQTESESCSCSPGFELNMEDFVSCNNINECSGELSPCDQNCTDTNGSFVCSCQAGYMQDGNQCNDIDECQDLSMMRCGVSMLCNNTDGGFECICPAGTELFDNMCALPTMPPITTEPPNTSPTIIENSVEITLPDISVEMFTPDLQQQFRMEVAEAINMFCSDSDFGQQCSFFTVIRSKRQVMISLSSIVISNIMAGAGGNGTVFNLYVLGVGQTTVLSVQAVLNAINNNRQALMNAGFNFIIVPVVPMTTQTTQTSTTAEPTGGLTPGEIAGIVVAGIAGVVLLLIIIISCIYWCRSRSRSGKIVFNTYGRDPSAKSTLKSVHLRGGDMIEENLYVTRSKGDKDNQSMQSVQLEFTESRSEPSPQPIDPPDYDEVTGDKEKVNLVDDDEADRGLPQFDISINFIEDADKDTPL